MGNKVTSFLLCHLVLLVGKIQAKPGLLDAVTSFLKDCDDIQDDITWGSNECAMVFDDDDCSDDGLKIEEGETSFSRTTLNLFLISWRKEIDAIITRRGCELTAYKDSDCRGDSKVVGSNEIDDDLKDFEDEIKCLKCRC